MIASIWKSSVAKRKQQPGITQRASGPGCPLYRVIASKPLRRSFLRMNARSVRRDSIIWQGDVADAAAVFRNTGGTETFLGAKQTLESPWLPGGLLTSGTTGCSLLARAPPSRLWKRRPRVRQQQQPGLTCCLWHGAAAFLLMGVYVSEPNASDGDIEFWPSR